jgi:hypothetical protein
MAPDKYLLENLSQTTAYEAIELLCQEFGLGRSVISFLQTKNRAELRTFLTATYLDSMLASDIGPIEFWGGPPAGRRFLRGSLLTYLFDVILFNWAVGGNYADLVCGAQIDHENKLQTIK